MNASEIAFHSGSFTLTEAELHRVSIPMHEPFRISSGEVSEKEAILLRIGDGRYSGWGESSAMPGNFYSLETPETCYQDLRHRVLPHLLDRAFSSMLTFERELEALSQNRFVRAAVETAAWDLIARRKHVSLRQLFQIPDRPVPSGLAIGLYPTIRELESAIHRYGPRQYGGLKLKIQPGCDVQLVKAARKLVGDFPMFVDANAAYDSSGLAAFKALDDISPYVRAAIRERRARWPDGIAAAGAHPCLPRRKHRNRCGCGAIYRGKSMRYRQHQTSARRRLSAGASDHGSLLQAKHPHLDGHNARIRSGQRAGVDAGGPPAFRVPNRC